MTLLEEYFNISAENPDLAYNFSLIMICISRANVSLLWKVSSNQVNKLVNIWSHSSYKVNKW